MKRKYLSILVLALFILSSCFKQHGTLNSRFGVEHEDSVVHIVDQLAIVDTAITITVPEYDPTMSNIIFVEDVVDTLFYIRLETADDFLIGKIDKMEIVEDSIYILDKATKSIFTFSMDGKRGCKIGRVGNGPGEYTEPTSMTVSKEFVYVYDQWQHKVIKYDHKGKVVSDHMTPFFCMKVFPIENGDVMCFGAGMDNFHLPKILNYCFWQCDSTYKTISKCGLFSESTKTIVNGTIPLNHYNGNYYYFHYKTNDYYQISPKGEIIHLVHFNIENDYPEDFYTNLDYRLKAMEDDNAMAVTNVFVSNRHVVYDMTGYGYPCYIFQSLTDNSCRFGNLTNDIKSQFTRVLHITSPLYVFDDMFVFNYRPEHLLRKIKTYKKKNNDLWEDAPKACREFDKKLIESLHEEDNDILVFAKLKEHFD